MTQANNVPDPLSILLAGTNPVCHSIDLTGDPTVEAALQASFQDESLLAAGRVFVGILSRVLSMLGPFGAAASYALTGQDMPSQVPQDIQAAVTAALARTPAAAATSATTSACPISGMLQQLASNPSALLADVQRLAGLFGK